MQKVEYFTEFRIIDLRFILPAKGLVGNILRVGVSCIDFKQAQKHTHITWGVSTAMRFQPKNDLICQQNELKFVHRICHI